MGLINFDESAMLDLRSLADEVWQVHQADTGPRRTSNTILVAAGLPATIVAPAYLALGHTEVSTSCVAMVRAENMRPEVGLSTQIGDTYADPHGKQVNMGHEQPHSVTSKLAGCPIEMRPL